MYYPILLSNHKRIIVAPEGWFDRIGSVDLTRQTIEIGISPLGENSLAWILDARAQLFTLEWRGKISKSLLQKLGLVRQRELYAIGRPRQVTAREVLKLIADHGEQFEEAPNTADLRNALRAVPPDLVLSAEFMSNYLGISA